MAKAEYRSAIRSRKLIMEAFVDLLAEKPLTGKSWRCGFANPRLYAAFPHLYLAGRPELARRFVAAAAAYHTERETIAHGSDE